MNISVVIVTYNTGSTWLDKCLSSLKLCSLSLSIILIDNASSDGSAEYVKVNYPEVDLICSSENLGFAKANNIGIAKAFKNGAEHVFLLNHDAWIIENCIEKLIEIQKLYPQFGIVSPVHLNGDGTLLDWNFTKYISSCEDEGRKLYSDLIRGKPLQPIYDINFVNAAAWMLSRRCIEQVGLFDTELFKHYGEDTNYVQRVQYHKMKLGVVPNCIIFHDREDRSGKPLKSDIYSDNEVINYVVDASNVLLNSNDELIKYHLKNCIKNMVFSLIRFDLNNFIFQFKLFFIKREKISIIDQRKMINSRPAVW